MNGSRFEKTNRLLVTVFLVAIIVCSAYYLYDAALGMMYSIEQPQGAGDETQSVGALVEDPAQYEQILGSYAPAEPTDKEVAKMKAQIKTDSMSDEQRWAIMRQLKN